MDIDSAQFRYCAVRRVNHEKHEYLGENETKFENISTHYSVAKADSNYEKTVWKSRLTVPLKRILKSHMIPRSMILRRAWLDESETKNETKNENILTQWLMDQAGSNNEKNWGSKISWDFPFKVNSKY